MVKMGNIKNIINLFYILMFFLTCIRNDNSLNVNTKELGPGGLKLLIHDAPVTGNVSELNVTVIEVTILPMDGSPGVVISNESKSFNLVTLTPANPFVLADTIAPAGQYKEIRLKFASNSTIVVDGISRPLKTPSAMQSGYKVKGYFAISESGFTSLTLDMDPNKSVVHNPAPDTYVLKPVIHIASSSLLPGGTFNVSGLVANTTIVTELNPDGSFRMATSFDPRIEIRGYFFYNLVSRVLHIEPESVLCQFCGNLTIPVSSFTDVKPVDIQIEVWHQNAISGNIVPNTNGVREAYVSFNRTPTFFVAGQPSTHVQVTVSYPNANYNNKVGIISAIKPVNGANFLSMQTIVNQQAVFDLFIRHSELGQNIGDFKQFYIHPFITDNVSKLTIDGSFQLIESGITGISKARYRTDIHLSNKVISNSIAYTEGL